LNIARSLAGKRIMSIRSMPPVWPWAERWPLFWKPTNRPMAVWLSQKSYARTWVPRCLRHKGSQWITRSTDCLSSGIMGTHLAYDSRYRAEIHSRLEARSAIRMSTSMDPRREHPSTYFVQDRSDEEELTRIIAQDRILTSGMGGVLVEQPDPAAFGRVLDVSCGTGGWLIEVAKSYPTITSLVGVDVSRRMIEYAQTQAATQLVSDRVEFRTMDALRML